MLIQLRMIAFVLLPGVIVMTAMKSYPIEPRYGLSVVAGSEYDGEYLTNDLPLNEHIKNIGSHVDGAGMCVSSSMTMAAVWQGMDEFRGFRDWCANYPGGGYPDKMDKQIAQYCKEKGIRPPQYIQYEGRNPEEILKACDATGRIACITYGKSPRYGGTIAHMTCCVKFSGKYAVCLDNNFPKTYEWMSLQEMVSRINHPNGTGWVFVWLTPSPPPVPKN